MKVRHHKETLVFITNGKGFIVFLIFNYFIFIVFFILFLFELSSTAKQKLNKKNETVEYKSILGGLGVRGGGLGSPRISA